MYMVTSSLHTVIHPFAHGVSLLSMQTRMEKLNEARGKEAKKRNQKEKTWSAQTGFEP